MSPYQKTVVSLLEGWETISQLDDTISPHLAFAYKMDALCKIVAIEIQGCSGDSTEILSFFTTEVRKILDFLNQNPTPHEGTLQ
jgi:hypothetical protein